MTQTEVYSIYVGRKKKCGKDINNGGFRTPPPSNIDKTSVKWFPKPDNWSEVVSV